MNLQVLLKVAFQTTRLRAERAGELILRFLVERLVLEQVGLEAESLAADGAQMRSSAV